MDASLLFQVYNPSTPQPPAQQASSSSRPTKKLKTSSNSSKPLSRAKPTNANLPSRYTSPQVENPSIAPPAPPLTFPSTSVEQSDTLEVAALSDPGYESESELIPVAVEASSSSLPGEDEEEARLFSGDYDDRSTAGDSGLKVIAGNANKRQQTAANCSEKSSTSVAIGKERENQSDENYAKMELATLDMELDAFRVQRKRRIEKKAEQKMRGENAGKMGERR